ncbi:MAG: metallophosphoesterase [bacterium]
MNNRALQASRRLAVAVPLTLCLALFAAAAPDKSSFRVKHPKITAIQSPSLGKPVIARAGSDFELVVLNDVPGEVKKVYLTPAIEPARNVQLDFARSGESETTASYKVTIPAGAGDFLYDLSIETSDGATDTQPHSVKVVREFLRDFRFAILSDIHFGDARGENFAPGGDFDTIRIKALQEACGLNPEFVLLTGDAVSMPTNYKSEYEKAWRHFRDYCPAPLFIVPGNHDLYGLKKKGGVFMDGLDYWRAHFGPPYFHFDYGGMRFIGINNYDWPAEFRSGSNLRLMALSESINTGNMGPAQFEWLKNTLKNTAGEKTIVPFAHLPLDEMRGGAAMADGKTIPGIRKEEIIELLRQFGVEYVFIGHWHHNETKDLGGVRQVMTNTSGSVLYREEDRWGFNTVYVRGWKIARIEFTEVDLR